VAEVLPEQPEALGLLALMLYAEARRSARRDAQGEYVPLAQQDSSLWNETMISSPWCKDLNFGGAGAAA
jgi:RNA polymerase sigma-70 factor (ECF subfamily)